MWSALALVCSSAAFDGAGGAYLHAGWISPAFSTLLLLKVSGVPMVEKAGENDTGQSLGSDMRGGEEHGQGDLRDDLDTEQEDNSFLTEVDELENSATKSVASNGKQGARGAKNGTTAEDEGAANNDEEEHQPQKEAERVVPEDLDQGVRPEGEERGVQEERSGEVEVAGGELSEGRQDDAEMDEPGAGTDSSSIKRTVAQAAEGSVSPAKSTTSPSKRNRSKKQRGDGTPQRLDFQSPPGGNPGPPGGARRRGRN